MDEFHRDIVLLDTLNNTSDVWSWRGSVNRLSLPNPITRGYSERGTYFPSWFCLNHSALRKVCFFAWLVTRSVLLITKKN